MENKLLMDLLYVKLYKYSSGWLYLSIEGTELFDFIDDYIIEQSSIEILYYKIDKETHKIYFNQKFEEVLKTHLSKIDNREIKRIYELNNSTKPLDSIN